MSTQEQLAGSESAAPKNRDTRRRRETKERLFAAAAEVFAEVGIGGASIELISERAGFTRGAFYSNFSSKEELLVALVEQEQVARVERLDRAITIAMDAAMPTTMDEVVGLVLESFFELHEPSKTWLMMRREFQLSALRDPRVAEIFTTYETAAYDRIAETVVAALERAGLRPTVAPNILARVLESIFEFGLQESFLDAESTEAPEAAVARTLTPVLARLTEFAE